MARKWQDRLAGHETMRQITTTAGNVWCVAGRKAWPLMGPATGFGGYDADVARALGQEVDADLPRSDYRVTNAGPDWREVYDRLHGEPARVEAV